MTDLSREELAKLRHHATTGTLYPYASFDKETIIRLLDNLERVSAERDALREEKAKRVAERVPTAEQIADPDFHVGGGSDF